MDGTSNLGMCMTAYALKEAYPHVSSGQQAVILTNLKYLQRAILVTQQKNSTHMAQYAFPSKPGSTQYSTKTNAMCGLAFIELYEFWNTLSSSDNTLNSYSNDAKRAAMDINTFLKRLQQPNQLPGLTLSSSTFYVNLGSNDSNADGIYDGIFEEILDGKLVMSTATWSAMAGRFFNKLSALGWSEVNAADLANRANGMKKFFSTGLGLGAEHYSPTFMCNSSSCYSKLDDLGYSIAKVWNFNRTTSRVTGGDNRWHVRITHGDAMFANLNGSDPFQWALNALYAIDPNYSQSSHFSKYWSRTTKQARKNSATDKYEILDSNSTRDIFLGLATYTLHGTVTTATPRTFNLSSSGTDIAHYVKKDNEFQIVTSHYGDNAVAAWAPSEWETANKKLLQEYTLNAPSTRVYLANKYDFDTLSHLAHWAMTINTAGVLQPKQSETGAVTVSSENMASMMCRVLRAWKGKSECTM
jgi:hypothetical protein